MFTAWRVTFYILPGPWIIQQAGGGGGTRALFKSEQLTQLPLPLVLPTYPTFYILPPVDPIALLPNLLETTRRRSHKD